MIAEMSEEGVETRIETPQGAPELEIAADLARRSIWVVPVALFGGAIGWGMNGVASAGIGVALAVANLVAAAFLITRSVRVSPNALMVGALGGFLVRLSLLTGIAVLLRRLSWIEDIPLLFTVFLTHLVLLVWETRYVQLSLAHPGLKPRVAPRKARSS